MTLSSALTLALIAVAHLPDVRARLIAGDLAEVERIRLLYEERGVDTRTGSMALADDLSRLMRCLPLGPIPESEREPYLAARRLVRFERIRLERLMRDGRPSRSALKELLGDEVSVTTSLRTPSASLVRWPKAEERWPDEVPFPSLERSACPHRPGALREGDRALHWEAGRVRAAAERRALTELLGHLDALPKQTRGKLALTYLALAAEAGDGFEVPKRWRDALLFALLESRPPIRSAGLLLLAKLDLAARPESARRALEVVLRDPRASNEEDSRARVMLLSSIEPNWERVLQVATGARAPRPEDVAALLNAEARALFALGRTEELRRFGRRFVVAPPPEGALRSQTEDLLLESALGLPLEEAIAWVLEIAPNEPSRRAEKLDELGRIALEHGMTDLASAVYDRLRLEVSRERPRERAHREARWIARRVVVEYERVDVAAFGGLLDELVASARAEGHRYAPHRELTKIAQDLTARLQGDVKADAERRKLAALLLESTVALARTRSRYQKRLEALVPALAILAGGYAEGTDGRASREARRPDRPPVRQLGEVIVPRLPPRLAAEDHPTAVPVIESFLIHEAPDGTWVEAPPWR